VKVTLSGPWNGQLAVAYRHFSSFSSVIMSSPIQPYSALSSLERKISKCFSALLYLTVSRVCPLFLPTRAVLRKRGAYGTAEITPTGKSRCTWRNTFPIVSLSTTNVTWTGLGLNTSLHGERPATNRQSYGTALRNQH
jgi:hypothetical protein